MKQRILFVEDNLLLLEMYAMMLSGEPDQWNVATAEDAREGLGLMAQLPFDVIVSDLRMPGMDGVELLQEVRKLYPRTSRIIVSGVGDQEEIASSLGSTHQFLAKPFDTKTLKSTLARLRGLDTYLRDEKLKALVGRIHSLPSFPSLYLRIMKEINSPDASLDIIAKIVAEEPSLTAKTLQIVNSAALGLPQRIHDPFVAVQQLGMNTMRSLALSAHVFARFEQKSAKNFDPAALWAHLMATGQLARRILQVEQADAADIEDACTAGMLHDIGKLMLAEDLPSEFQRALTLADEKNLSPDQAEGEVYGATHAGIAAYLLGLWGLPTPVVEAVAFHHTPVKSELQKLSPLTAVHVANVLIHERSKQRACGRPAEVDLAYLAALDLDSHLDNWRNEAAKLANSDAG